MTSENASQATSDGDLDIPRIEVITEQPRSEAVRQIGVEMMQLQAMFHMMASGEVSLGDRDHWMERPEKKSEGFPGIEFLEPLNKLTAEQHFVFKKQKRKKRIFLQYKMKNARGKLVYVVRKEGEHDNVRVMHVLSSSGEEVMTCTLTGNATCHACCVCCCDFGMTIEAPPGKVLGNIRHRLTLGVGFDVESQDGGLLLELRANTLPCCCRQPDLEFKILEPHTKKVLGEIGPADPLSSRIAGKPFDITFPEDADLKTKALIIGASIFIGRLYYAIIITDGRQGPRNTPVEDDLVFITTDQ